MEWLPSRCIAAAVRAAARWCYWCSQCCRRDIHSVKNEYQVLYSVFGSAPIHCARRVKLAGTQRAPDARPAASRWRMGAISSTEDSMSALVVVVTAVETDTMAWLVCRADLQRSRAAVKVRRGNASRIRASITVFCCLNPTIEVTGRPAPFDTRGVPCFPQAPCLASRHCWEARLPSQ